VGRAGLAQPVIRRAGVVDRETLAGPYDAGLGARPGQRKFCETSSIVTIAFPAASCPVTTRRTFNAMLSSSADRLLRAIFAQDP
jgi:hypothetical protein